MGSVLKSAVFNRAVPGKCGMFNEHSGNQNTKVKMTKFFNVYLYRSLIYFKSLQKYLQIM